MIYFLTKNVDKYSFDDDIIVTDDEQLCEDILSERKFMGYDKEATSLNTLLARELLDSWGDADVQVVVDRTTCNPAFAQRIADKYVLHGFNIKYDYTLAKFNGLNIKRVKDAMLREQRLGQGSGRANTLLATYERRCNKTFPTQKKTRDDFINWPKGQLFEAHHIVYSAGDVKILPEIFAVQEVLITSLNMNFLISIEDRLCPILGDMEIEGFYLNEVAWRGLVDDNKRKKANAELLLDSILEQMKPIFPTLNGYKFKRNFNEQTSLFGENTDAGVKGFNYSSSNQVLSLFKAAGLPIPTQTKKDFKLKKKVTKPSIAEQALKEYLILYPKTPFKVFIEALLIYTKIEKLINSFGMRFIQYDVHEKGKKPKLGYKNYYTHKVHTTYRQCMTATSRLASGDEKFGYYNSQQLPKQNRYRNCFILSEQEKAEGWKICTLDLSGAEVVILTALSGELKILQYKDIHSELCTPAYQRVLNHIKQNYRPDEWITQTKILLSNTKFECTTEEATIAIKDPNSYTIDKVDTFRAEIRDDFKRVVYGLFYGGTASRIAEVLGISKEWAELIEGSLKEQLPLLFKYLEDNAAKGVSTGIITFNTRTNSRHIFKSYLDAAKFQRALNKVEKSTIERNCKNYPIQGTQADMIKEGIVEVMEWVWANNIDFVLKLQVHDEIVFKFKEQSTVDMVEKIILDTCNKYLVPGVEMKAAYHIADFWEK